MEMGKKKKKGGRVYKGGMLCPVHKYLCNVQEAFSLSKYVFHYSPRPGFS